MKYLKHTLAWSTVLLMTWCALRLAGVKTPTERAVASTYTEWYGMLAAGNFTNAYGMMTADYRERHGISEFIEQYRSLTTSYGDTYQLHDAYRVTRLRGMRVIFPAESGMGSGFAMKRESGNWRISDDNVALLD